MKWKMIVASACTAAVWLAMPAASAQQAYSGSHDYQVYCSSCHGATAKGDGVIAKSLAKRPPDLTQLTRRGSGVFPEEAVTKTIDGRGPGSGHSNPDMPVWSDVFAKSADSLGLEASTARIATLVQYLKTIQEKP